MRKNRYQTPRISPERKSHRYRTWILGGCTFVAIILLAAQSFHLQITQGREYALQLERIRLGREVESSIRGKILDRQGIVLASTTVRRLINITETFKGVSGQTRQKLIEEVAWLCGVSVLVVQEALMTWEDLPLRPDVIVTNPDVVVTLSFRRNYSFEGSMSHIVGYVNRDLQGVTGIEGYYDQELRGTPGEKIKEMDSTTRVVQYKLVHPPTHGNDIHLSIDAQLQEWIDKRLISIGKPAVVILSNPQTGEIRSMNSVPFYSSDEMSNWLTTQRWQELQKDDSYPFINRAIQSTYNPGSLIKPFIALSALQSSESDVQNLVTERILCRGHFDLALDTGGTTRYRDWLESGHGITTLFSAIAESCNVFFYQLGIRLGIAMLKEVADMILLDAKSGIDLPSEARGVFPSGPWKENQIGERWYTGDTVLASIGEGYIRLTPLSLLKLFELIGNEGWTKPARFVERSDYRPTMYIDMPKGYWTYLKYALNAVINQSTGTAYTVFRGADYAHQLAGKTGTAETGTPGIYHSWFAGFYPLDNPHLAIIVLVESGGYGSTTAAPLARQILDYWWMHHEQSY